MPTSWMRWLDNLWVFIWFQPFIWWRWRHWLKSLALMRQWLEEIYLMIWVFIFIRWRDHFGLKPGHLMKMKTLAPRVPVRSGVIEAAQVQKPFSSLPTSILLNCWQRGRRKIEMYSELRALLLWLERSCCCCFAFILWRLNYFFYLVCNMCGTYGCLCW
jgi:hypothetical protein